MLHNENTALCQRTNVRIIRQGLTPEVTRDKYKFELLLNNCRITRGHKSLKARHGILVEIVKKDPQRSVAAYNNMT